MDPRDTLGRILDGLALGDHSLSFDGETVALAQDLAQHPFPAAQPRITLLRDLLYRRAFTRAPGKPPREAASITAFAQRLSQANRGLDRWHEGWQVERPLAGGQLLAAKHGRRRRLSPGEYLLRDGGVAIWQARESHTAQPGFYYAFGQALADQAEEDAGLLRLYWNVGPAGALAVLGALSRQLNRFGLPFRFKCLIDSAAYQRLDAAVLYVARRHHRPVVELACETAAAMVPADIGPDTPLFARRLRPGLALAEDPPGGESFGMNRCRLLAEALWSAFDEGQSTTEARLAAVDRHFARYGVALAAPHLQAGSTYDYPGESV